jgi:hypothetical protein
VVSCRRDCCVSRPREQWAVSRAARRRLSLSWEAVAQVRDRGLSLSKPPTAARRRRRRRRRLAASRWIRVASVIALEFSLEFSPRRRLMRQPGGLAIAVIRARPDNALTHRPLRKRVEHPLIAPGEASPGPSSAGLQQSGWCRDMVLKVAPSAAIAGCRFPRGREARRSDRSGSAPGRRRPPPRPRVAAPRLLRGRRRGS